MCLFSIAQQEESCERYVKFCIHRIFKIFSPQLFSVLWNQKIQLPGSWGSILFLIYMQWHAQDTCWNAVFRVSLNQTLGAMPRTANISAYRLCKYLSLVCPCYVHIFTLIAINNFTLGCCLHSYMGSKENACNIVQWRGYIRARVTLTHSDWWLVLLIYLCKE